MMTAIVAYLYIFVMLLAANCFVLALLWILFLNLGMFEAPSEDHWSKKIIFFPKRIRSQLPWTLTYFVSDGAGSTDVYHLFPKVTVHQIPTQHVLTVSGSDWNEYRQEFLPNSPLTEPQTIHSAAA
jgi:hypothetical protein